MPFSCLLRVGEGLFFLLNIKELSATLEIAVAFGYFCETQKNAKR